MDQNDDINQIPQDLRDFLSGIMSEAGIAVDEKTHNQIIKELFVQLDNYMLSTIVEELPDDKLEDFTVMNEEGRPKEELEQYLQDNIPNSKEVFVKAMMDFKTLYLGNVAVARSAPNADKAPESPAPAPVDQTNDTDTNVN